MLFLFLRLLIFDLIFSFFLAKLEINIEGKSGWAENLPTWRIKNQFTQLLWGQQPYTGYHFWLLLSTLFFLHLPFFVSPQLFSWSLECFLLAHYFIGILLEDFLWFVLNPSYGIKRFSRKYIPWHDQWIGVIPVFYLRLCVFIAIFLALSFLLQH